MHNLITKPHTSVSKPKQMIPSILLVLIAFFAPWGSGLQKVTNFDLSKIFVGLIVLLIFYWALFVRHKFRTFPPYFNYFMLFAILHILVTYVVFFPKELRFGYIDIIQLQEGFIRLQETSGMMVARFFLFALMGYAFASLLRTKKQFIILSLAYGTGFSLIMVIGACIGGGYVTIEKDFLVRFAGSFLNPNSLGTSALMAVFLNIFVLTSQNVKILKRLFSIVFVGIGILGVLISGARSNMLGLFIGLLVMIMHIPKIQRKIQFIVGLLIIVSIVFLFVPQNFKETLKYRTSIQTILETRGAKRFDLWHTYIEAMPKYILIGNGYGRKRKVIQTFSGKIYTTHNSYLAVLVEFGLIGFLLFIMCLWQLWKKISYSSKQTKRAFSDCVVLGLFFAWLVMFIFRDYGGSRDLWIFLGIIAAYGSRKVSSKQNNLLLCRRPLPKNLLDRLI